MLVWNSMHVSSTAARRGDGLPWLPSPLLGAAPRSGRNLRATDLSASAGHTLNQSMVVQLTSDGNLQQRLAARVSERRCALQS
jgi:hypothetical protein